MYEKELQKTIKDLNSPTEGNIRASVLGDEFFLDQPQYLELKKQFHESEYHYKHWKWHQLVRLVLEPQEQRQHMYDRLLSLLLKHRRSYTDYFILKTHEGKYEIPNPLVDLNKLEILYQKYFEIYKNIKDQIHFDYPKNEHYGPAIKGKINWDKTIRNSSTYFPMMFVSSVRQKEFETPENILLVLCAEWMFRESSRLLQTSFKEPLTDHNKNLLNSIVEKTKLILTGFPFTSVLNSSKRFWNLSYIDPRIKELEQKTQMRIRQSLVKNSNYNKLLEWIADFRNLDISRVTDKTPTRHILDSIENIDTVYEAWIFLEFVEFLAEKGILVNFRLGNDPHCQFEYGGLLVTFWYERGFTGDGPYAWVLTCVPDFTVMINDEIIAIFDAKNYAKSSSTSDSQVKMLAYMTNLDANFGALIYPNHPKNWNDLNSDEKINFITSILKRKFPQETQSAIKQMAKNIAKENWNDLSEENQQELVKLSPRAVQKFEFPTRERKARYHFDQTLCLLRMSPEDTNSAIKMKNESLNVMFNAIVSRIPLIIK